MAKAPRSPEPDDESGGVSIGNVAGGIHGATIAGRDVVQTIHNIFNWGQSEVRDRRNQLSLLKKVKTYWVESVLEKLIATSALVELGKIEQNQAVQRSVGLEEVPVPASQRPLPGGKKIIEIFEASGSALLILGAPGSGKTISLLELARDAIARAEQDPAQPIPVILNLSAWAERRQKLFDWLVEELHLKYQIPKKIGGPWVENNDLLLLLDGLDEIEPAHQAACVTAINRFRVEHGLQAIAVCCRAADYEALATPLNLQGAIFLQPLTPEQIKGYFDSLSPKLDRLRALIAHDEALQELARLPLMLGVMSLAYQDLPDEALQRPEFSSVESRRNHLFGAYVNRMLARRKGERGLTPQQCVKGLAWLARKMDQHKQSVYMLEQLQPSWLSSRRRVWWYAVGSRSVGGLAFALATISLWAGISRANSHDAALLVNLFFPVLFGCLGSGVMMGLTVGRRFRKTHEALAAGLPPLRRAPRPIWDLLRLAAMAVLGSVLGVAVLGIVPILGGAVLMRAFLVSILLVMGFPVLLLAAAISYGPLFVFTVGVRSLRTGESEDIQTVESLGWSWKKFFPPVLLIGVILGGIILAVTSATRIPVATLRDVKGTSRSFQAGPEGRVEFACFDHGGTRILTLTEGGRVFLWDGHDARLLSELKGGRWNAFRIHFSADDARIISGGLFESGIRLWGAEHGILIKEFDGDGEFSPDGKSVITRNHQQLLLASATNGAPIVSMPTDIERVRSTSNWFSPDGTRFLGIGVGEKAELWDIPRGVQIALLSGAGPEANSAFSPDGERIVTLDKEYASRLWNGRTGEPIAALASDGSLFNPVSFNPPGTRILTSSGKGQARLWDAKDGSPLPRFALAETEDRHFAFNRDSSRILAHASTGEITLWRSEDGTLVSTLEAGSPGHVGFSRFSPDGDRVTTVRKDGSVGLWNARDGAFISSLPIKGIPENLRQGHPEESKNFPLFSPDGQVLLTVDGEGSASLWKGTDGTPIKTLDGILNPTRDNSNSYRRPFDAYFNPTGTHLATIDQDRTLRLWETKTGALTATIADLGQFGDTDPIAFSSDGAKFVALSSLPPSDRRPYSAIGMLVGLLVGLVAGLQARVRETKTQPNQGIWLSARNAVLAGLVGGLLVAIATTLVLVLFTRPAGSILPLSLGLMGFVGTLIALRYGGMDVIQHTVLRLILSRDGGLPLKQSPVLDHAAECILLRKIGGGYIFVHRLLLEYFARQEPEK